MKIITNPKELQTIRANINSSVGFIPTMGALHDGHISLIKQSKEQNNITIVSIFVNPTQFLANEDFDKYPQTQAKDIKICQFLKADYLFMPQIKQIYQKDEVQIQAPSIQGYILEGYTRAGHFDGVLQIVLKLFGLINPTNAYFGKKDAQQLYLIQKMVKNLFLDIHIIPCEIIREPDGLAMSSRNIYLSSTQRQQALSISKSLKKAAKMVGMGELDTSTIQKQMQEVMQEIQIEYIAFVNRDFECITQIQISNTIILVVAKVGNTRLLDNIWI